MRLLVLPILVPLTTAAVLMLAPKRPLPQRWVSLAGSILLLASTLLVFFRVNAAGIQVLNISGWPAPFGITLVADLLAVILVVAVGVVGTAVSVVAFSGVDPRREAFGYHPLLQILLMGVSGAFLTGDFFNLYVWFEVMLVASFVLMALNRTRAQMGAAFKYVTINLIASSIFLTALGLLYGATGTLNMAELARVWPTMSAPGVDIVLAVLFLIAFSIKAGLFPLFFWLPASYHTPPAPIAAAFAGLLTKVGVYALIRVFTLLFHDAPPALFALLLAMSVATMAIGLVAALSERDFRRVLSFNLVGHIGYTTASLSLFTPAALAGAIFYVVHHIVVITNLYLVSGVLLRLRRTTDMAGLGGMYRDQPVFSALAMVPIFSLAGVPPLSGFLGKLAILEGAFSAGAYWTGGLVLVVGLLTLLSMSRTWADSFWRPAVDGNDFAGPGTSFLVAIAALSLLTVGMTISAEPLFELASRSAHQLLHHEEYVRAVLEHTLMLLGSILLALAWAALQGEMTLANLLVGYAVGYTVLAVLVRGGVLPSTLVSRTSHALGLAAFFAWELVLANFRVAADVLRGNGIEPAVVAIPLDITSDGEILLLSMLINITPGSVTIDLSDDRRTLYVHVMHMKSAAETRRDIKDGFERRVKLLFQ